MSINEMKSCPVCGDDNVKVKMSFFVSPKGLSNPMYDVECPECWLKTTEGYFSLSQAIQNWNCRSSDDEEIENSDKE